jgi:hypothetical protein
MRCNIIASTAIFLMIAAVSFAQDRVDQGTRVRVRATSTIDSREGSLANYRGMVIDDVRGRNGRLVIPAGSPVQLKVRAVPQNKLRLDLEWVNPGGEQYALAADPLYVLAHKPAGAADGIIGALHVNGEIGGREVHIPRDTVLTFMLEDPVVIGEPNLQYDLDRDGAR